MNDLCYLPVDSQNKKHYQTCAIQFFQNLLDSRLDHKFSGILRIITIPFEFLSLKKGVVLQTSKDSSMFVRES